jgi:transcriptional regulator with XRE-family HTH domain
MPNQFGKLLRERRKKAGYTLAGLAGLLDITAARVSAIERGVEGPLNPLQIRKAARLIQTDPGVLLSAADKDLREAFQKQWPMTAALRSFRRRR